MQGALIADVIMIMRRKNESECKIPIHSLLTLKQNQMKGGKEMHNKKNGIVLLISLIILVLPITTAFANTFLEDKTMHLYKGETGEYCIYLQNTGEEDLVQVIKIFEGEEYIRNLKEIQREFDVPVGTVSDNLPVCMKLRLPNDAEKGEKYPISYGVTSPSSNNEDGIVSIAPIQIRETFYLTEKLDKRPTPISMYIILALFGMAIFGIIIGYRYSRRNKIVKELKDEEI